MKMLIVDLTKEEYIPIVLDLTCDSLTVTTLMNTECELNITQFDDKKHYKYKKYDVDLILTFYRKPIQEALDFMQ